MGNASYSLFLLLLNHRDCMYDTLHTGIDGYRVTFVFLEIAKFYVAFHLPVYYLHIDNLIPGIP